MLVHLIALSLVGHGFVATPQTALKSDEVRLIATALRAMIADETPKSQTDDFGEAPRLNAQKNVRDYNFVLKDVSLGTYPEPPTEEQKLKRWLYFNHVAWSALGFFSSLPDAIGGSSAEKLRATALAKKLESKFEDAVRTVSSATLKDWGVSSKKFADLDLVANGFIAPQTEWFSEAKPAQAAYTGPITQTLDIADGETVSAERSITIDLKSSSLPTKVEFYVEGELRGISESKPFRFTIDALDEQDGDLNLKFVGYDESGGRTEKSVKVKIDSGASQGVGFQVERARTAFSSGDYLLAERAARTALRVDPENVDAKLVAASASYRLRHIDLAEKYALDVELAQPGNLQNLDLLAGISVFKAFETRSAGDAEATALTISESVLAAAKYRARADQGRADAALAEAGSDPIKQADAYIAMGRFGLAIDAVKRKVEQTGFTDNASVARLAFSQVRLSRYGQAWESLRSNARAGQPDAYLKALSAVVADRLDKDADAERFLAVIGGGWASRTAAAAVRSSANGSEQILRYVAEIDALKAEKPGDVVTAFHELRLAYARREFESQVGALRRGLTDNAASYDFLLEQANQLASFRFKAVPRDLAIRRLMQAKGYFKAALEVQPDAPEAVCGYALYLALVGDWQQALSMADAARRVSRNYPAGQLTYAAIISEAPLPDVRTNPKSQGLARDRYDMARAALKEAGRLDARFEKLAPSISNAFIWYQRLGRPAFVASPAQAYSATE